MYRIVKLLFCAPEINTMLYVNYISIIVLFKTILPYLICLEKLDTLCEYILQINNQILHEVAFTLFFPFVITFSPLIIQGHHCDFVL